MSDTAYLTAEDVKGWFSALLDDGSEKYDIGFEDELIDLPYRKEGYILAVPGVTDYQVTVATTNTERTSDSYGYSYLEDGYVILAVTGQDGTAAHFKLPISYASFEGWSWDLSELTKVQLTEKVITTYEWAGI